MACMMLSPFDGWLYKVKRSPSHELARSSSCESELSALRKVKRRALVATHVDVLVVVACGVPVCRDDVAAVDVDHDA